MSLRVLVVGAGIAGLTTAVALAREGHEVELWERAGALVPVGAGITIQSNAHAVLAALGVALPPEDVRALGCFEVQSADGRALLAADPEQAGGAAPSVAIHRAALSAALVRALGAVPLTLGRALVSVEQGASGVRARFSDGHEGEWDLLVGADGIHSTVRGALLGAGAGPLRYSGQTCWRLTLHHPADADPLGTERWFGDRRVGIVPLSAGRTYVFLVQTAPVGTPTAGSATLGELRARFGALRERLDRILDRVPEQGSGAQIHHGDLFDQPTTVFGSGRIVLIGDASHATTPNMGQGAGMGIEDAAALALVLRAAPTDAREWAARASGPRLPRWACLVSPAAPGTRPRRPRGARPPPPRGP